MRKVIIVQARMASTRLPGKILKKVMGKTLLEYQIERLSRVSLADRTVIATTINESDLPVVELCNRLSVPCFRGSEEDVLSRYHGAALLHEADAVVRITSDCPLIDPYVVDKVIDFYLKHYPEYDYVSNTIKRTYPRGMDTEVFSFNALERAHAKATSTLDREHVTPFIHRQPERFNIANVCYKKDISMHRWTVDTNEDFELIEKIIANLYPVKPLFGMEDVLKLLEETPDWININAHVEQKLYGQ